MSTFSLEPLFHIRRKQIPTRRSKSKKSRTVSFVNCSSKHVVSNARSLCNFRPLHTSPSLTVAAASTDTTTLEAFQSVHVNKTFPINRTEMDEETGVWYQHKGRDFKVPLSNYLKEDAYTIGPKRGFNFWPGALGQLSNMLFKSEATCNKGQSNSNESRDHKQGNSQLEGFYVELPITKQVSANHSISVSIKKCSETAKYLLYLETDIPGDVVLHWGVCWNEARRWEISPAPHPPETVIFKDRALRTPLQPRDSGKGCSIIITLGEDFSGFLYVLKLNGTTWLNYMGNEFYFPLSSSRSSSSLPINNTDNQSEGAHIEETEETRQTGFFSIFTDGIINGIMNLVLDISSEKSRKTNSKEAQENILQEIERLAAEAYSIFRNSVPTFPMVPTVEPEAVVEEEKQSLPSKICSGTGTGYEILCQRFNWESHKSGRWYIGLKEKAAELASLGFSLIWLPPPTESASPEGYMPKDLYNLNYRYGTIYELKDLVKRFHEVGIKVLGDAVINHRCAQYQNQYGVWNVFGGPLNWDDRAVIADDPHFQSGKQVEVSRRLTALLISTLPFTFMISLFPPPLLARERRNKKTIPIQDYRTSPDGLKYYDLVEGKGPVAEKGSTVQVHFDCIFRGITAVSSRESKLLAGNRIIAQPYEFMVGAPPGKERKREYVDNPNGLFSAQAAPKPPPAMYLITEGMRAGGKRTVIVPPENGYGQKGMSEIPPGATFELNIELLQVVSTEK